MPASVRAIRSGDHYPATQSPEVAVPTAVEAERGIIGAVVTIETQRHAGDTDRDILAEVGGLSLTADFFVVAHRAVWGVLCERHQAGLSNDLGSLYDALSQRNLTLPGVRMSDVAEWSLSFSETMVSIPSLAARYAADIRESAARRRAIEHAWTLIGRLGSHEKRPLVEWYVDAVAPLTSVAVPVQQCIPIGDHVSAVMRHVGQLLESGRIQRPGLPTGIRGLDRMLGGLRPGTLVVVGARPGIGKSAFATGVILEVARRHPAALISCEMPADEFVQRLISQVSHTELARLWRGPYGPQDHAPTVEAAAYVSRLPIYIDDDVVDWPAVLGRLQQRVAQGARCICIDYLGLLEVHDGRLDGWERLGVITRQAKQFAKRHNVPVLMLAQLNREAARDPNKRPTKNELRGSGNIEQDADVVILLHRPGAHDPTSRDDQAEIIVDKHRGGPTGIVSVRWRREIARFEDLDHWYGPSPGAETEEVGDCN